MPHVVCTAHDKRQAGVDGDLQAATACYTRPRIVLLPWIRTGITGALTQAKKQIYGRISNFLQPHTKTWVSCPVVSAYDLLRRFSNLYS